MKAKLDNHTKCIVVMLSVHETTRKSFRMTSTVIYVSTEILWITRVSSLSEKIEINEEGSLVGEQDVAPADIAVLMLYLKEPSRLAT